ncbi:hypothetical protein MACK_000606 [Theileria orientalis]|uniref:Uncharacterized protein n=1 Tax=Theileria orientalis TaxID=68886 RepID=A0A976MCE2_THEOR|nr:hypothetical protein MACK_000606 [Theileria orientalis]
MGARQSHLNIILESSDYKCNQPLEDKGKYTLESSKGLYKDCNDFEVVTYNINHTEGDGTNYDIYIYNTKDLSYKGAYAFAYCSPSYNQVATRVEVYYSVLAPTNPLVISFVTRSQHSYHCPFDRLKSVGWDWASNITEYASENLLDLLKKQYLKISWNKTIKFTKGNDNKDVKVQRQEIDDSTYYRVILLPEGKECVLGSECLCYFNFGDSKVNCKSKNGNNKIDTYYLESLFDKYYPGIILYFARKTPKSNANQGKANEDKDYDNTLLLVEFIHSCKTTTLRRMDKDCCLWAGEQVKYTKYDDRLKELQSIYQAAQNNVTKTIFLDKISSNICNTTVKSEQQNVYNKYQYEFEQKSKAVLLFERRTITIGSFTSAGLEVKQVDVYYLKFKGAKDEEQDVKPFLIVIDKNGKDTPKKAYHFKYGFGFDKWEEFEKVEGLQGKLEEIKKNITCSLGIDLLRMMVYNILIGEKPPPAPAAPPGVHEERPKVVRPETGPEGLSLGLIIGCSVGGVLLISGLAIGYGVYWYNTTIKLLT